MSSHTVQVAIYRVYLKIDKFIKIHFYTWYWYWCVLHTYIYMTYIHVYWYYTHWYYVLHLVLTEMVHVGIITGSQVCTEVPL